jgi:hypothetical protein
MFTWHLMGGLVWFDKTVHPCQGPTSFIAYERFGDIWVFPCFSQWWFSHAVKLRTTDAPPPNQCKILPHIKAVNQKHCLPILSQTTDYGPQDAPPPNQCKILPHIKAVNQKHCLPTLLNRQRWAEMQLMLVVDNEQAVWPSTYLASKNNTL